MKKLTIAVSILALLFLTSGLRPEQGSGYGSFGKTGGGRRESKESDRRHRDAVSEHLLYRR
ncbi:hypothetical protein LJK87_03135 [Paenibacillus sp. P25]|nr:hypothetical protein LJK87_03135 [Paenibacillus sp. P25]